MIYLDQNPLSYPLMGYKWGYLNPYKKSVRIAYIWQYLNVTNDGRYQWELILYLVIEYSFMRWNIYGYILDYVQKYEIKFIDIAHHNNQAYQYYTEINNLSHVMKW